MSLLHSHKALAGCSSHGSQAAPRCVQATYTYFSCVARCQSSAGRSSSRLPDVATSASKYDRIIAFVEAHATPVVADGSSSSGMFHAEAEQFSSWHNSYDEEAEEGELLDEPHLVLAAAAAALPASSAFAAAAAAPAAAATVLVNSWSYGNAENPKPWSYSWDEEAEGGFELADCAQVTPAQLRKQRRAAVHEARHAARVDRKMRRAQLHPQLGDLEHMTAWVGQQQQQEQQQQQKPAAQRVAASRQYQQLLAMVAGDAGRQYRKPKQWHLTFDEDVHGDAPDAVLGSC